MKGPQATQLAGWLFADLLLVMVLVVLGGQLTAPADTPAAAPVPSPTASAAPSRSAPPGAVSRHTGMKPKSVELTGLGDVRAAAALTGGGGDAAAARSRVLARVRAGLRDDISDRVAMVFVWGSYGGCATCTPRDAESTAYATVVESFLREARLPGMPTSKTFYRAYHDLGGHPGDLRLELFVYYSD
ncbi:hypothetical protein ACIQGZ_10845 [Streptomyces sp. NPDC092296]|uniref:hypothetical protein n=1 Tax=Streptomyces sp. NPDC092296 TaxID=3366012 RepID=UPI0037F6DE26